MPWKERSVMMQRREFVALAEKGAIPMRQLCARFGISPDTGYRLLERFQADGEAGLSDQSRRPQRSPNRCAAAVEAAVLEVRRQHPAWGGRKIARVLHARGQLQVPTPSTITEILRRHGALFAGGAVPHPPWQRFARAYPNELWQMDFKGHFALRNGARCHPLTVLDDCSRFNLLLRACPNEERETVQTALIPAFERYGLPDSLLTDNGSPWGYDGAHPYTRLSLWLLRLGVQILHGRPYHPQTQGKEERFHRSLQLEVLRDRSFSDLSDTQRAFDDWRLTYNHERPHEALELSTPASRFGPSARPYPAVLPPVEYPPGTLLRRPNDHGDLRLHRRAYRLGRAFCGQTVGLQPTATDGLWDVYFSRFRLARLDEHQGLLIPPHRLDRSPPHA